MRSRSAGFIGATSIALANASALVLDAATQDWNSASSASVGVSFNRKHQAAASRSVDDEALPPGHSSSLIDDPSPPRRRRRSHAPYEDRKSTRLNSSH